MKQKTRRGTLRTSRLQVIFRASRDFQGFMAEVFAVFSLTKTPIFMNEHSTQPTLLLNADKATNIEIMTRIIFLLLHTHSECQDNYVVNIL
jgi:hypothetical protein